MKYRPEKTKGDLTPNCLFPIPEKEKKVPSPEMTNYYDELLELLHHCKILSTTSFTKSHLRFFTPSLSL